LPTHKPFTFAIRYSQQHKPKIAKEYVLPTLASLRKESQLVTMYKKHRAIVLNRKVSVYLQSPLNIKFGISVKDKSKIFIFS